MKPSLLLVLALVGSAAWAQETYSGSAAISPGREAAARRAAVAEAQAQAGERAGVTVSSMSQAGRDQTTLRVGPSAPVEVTDEWQDGEVYNVEARAGACDEQPYRRRITAVNFPVIRAEQVRVDDVHEFERGIPHELLRRLAVTGRYLTRGTVPNSLYEAPATAPDGIVPAVDGRSGVMDLADRLGSDYVLSGVIRDIGIDMPSFRLPDIGYVGTAGRRVEIEIFVHDGHTGTLLLRHGYAEAASGSVILDRRTPFGSTRFFQTDIGAAFERLLAAATAAVVDDLRCHPFTARILRVDGDELVIDAGSDTQLRVGDELIAYTTARDLLRDRTGRGRAPERRSAGQVTVVQVEADYAIARLSKTNVTSVRLQAGDLVASR